MKGVKGRILKKLKSIPQVGAHHGLSLDLLRPLDPSRVLRDLSVNTSAVSHGGGGGTGKTTDLRCDPVPFLDPKLLSDTGEEEDVDDKGGGGEEDRICGGKNHADKENIRPPPAGDDAAALSPGEEGGETRSNSKRTQLSDLDVWGFRRPKLNATSLFDPDLLAAFRQSVADYNRALHHVARAEAQLPPLLPPEQQTQRATSEGGADEVPSTDPLLEFEERCPPGGEEAVVLYTTSLRGIRKTFEDCSRVKFLLGSLRVPFYERDVSMHLGFREELWGVLGGGRVIPPRLFIKGRHVGGADEVVGLHERGKLLPLLKGLQRRGGDWEEGGCDGCGGFMFVLCTECHGSRKVNEGEGEGEGAAPVQCRRCNENGLVVCALCSGYPSGK